MRILLFIYFFFSIFGIDAQTITTVAGNGVQGFNGDSGPAINAQLHNPKAVAFDKLGNMYITDITNNRIRKVNSSGVITTIAGTGIAGYNGDNIPATTAQLNQPFGIICDTSGNIYVSDYLNARIRKINATGIITTLAGTGNPGYNGDGILAISAQINYPIGMLLDTLGNFYFSDAYNNRIRKISSSGIITTIAGVGTMGYSGDNGSAVSAQLNIPAYLTFDQVNNLYFTDAENHCIRKVNSSGIITTIAGTGTAGFSGDNGPAISAQLNTPFGIICDKTGNLYFTDGLNHRVRKIDPTGLITTIVGTGTAGYNGDNILATTAELYYPEGLVFDTVGNLYVADNYNNRIRKISNVGNIGVDEIKKNKTALTIYPNPNSGSFTVSCNAKAGKLAVEIYNVFGQIVLNKTFDIENANNIKIDNLSEGVYIVKLLIDGTQNKTERIIVTK